MVSRLDDVVEVDEIDGETLTNWLAVEDDEYSGCCCCCSFCGATCSSFSFAFLCSFAWSFNEKSIL